MLREGQELHVRYMRVMIDLDIAAYPHCGLEDKGEVNGMRILKRHLGVGNETRMLSEMLERNQIVRPIYYLTEQDAKDGVDRGPWWEQ